MTNGYWWCAECHEEVDCHRVTSQEVHDTCGRLVVWVEPKDPVNLLRAQLAALQSENAELLTQHRTEHCEAAGYDCEELGRLMSANAEKDKEIERLRLQRSVQVDGDVMALTLELAETKAALSRIEAERDASVRLLNDVWEMLDPDGPEGGYGEAAINMVAYLIYDKVRDYRHRFGAQEEGQDER